MPKFECEAWGVTMDCIKRHPRLSERCKGDKKVYLNGAPESKGADSQWKKVLQRGAVMRAAIVLCAVSLLCGCAVVPNSQGFCVDNATNRKMIEDRTKVALEGQRAHPDWSARGKAIYSFAKEYASYSSYFDAPPILYFSITFSCDGRATELQVTEWGTLQ